MLSTGRGGAGNMIEAKVSAATSVGTRTSTVNSDGELVVGEGGGGGGSAAANEVILTEEEWEQYLKGKGKGKSKSKLIAKMNRRGSGVGKIDEEKGGDGDGDNDNNVTEIGEHPVIASSGRGGVGNMTKMSRQPSAHVIHEDEETGNELSPVFSTGRGGAGNIYKTKGKGKGKGKGNGKGKVKVKAPRIEDELSPIHSGIRYRNGDRTETSGDDGVDVVLDAADSDGVDERKLVGRKGGIFGKLKSLFK
ncbi:hypothetical protein CANINC_000571 [Pichia inconspicua]|uniref:Uncharacterized protein n=1 Tax=Pichia inconspicua TaxID=52247 RepID=A0A4T0X687_9ASCO|nr:hypothetical protein CANINC_000571 [[Candida] inconspicua]